MYKGSSWSLFKQFFKFTSKLFYTLFSKLFSMSLFKWLSKDNYFSNNSQKVLLLKSCFDDFGFLGLNHDFDLVLVVDEMHLTKFTSATILNNICCWNFVTWWPILAFWSFLPCTDRQTDRQSLRTKLMTRLDWTSSLFGSTLCHIFLMQD